MRAARPPRRLAALGTASTIALGFVAGPALAQSAAKPALTASSDEGAVTEMIVVTAQRRSELQRDVPISITTIDKTQIQQANVTSLLSVPKLSTGVRIDQQGSYTQPTIRGIGTTVVQTGEGSSVGVYVDGFYLPNPLGVDLQFLNVESVQVLKGPQGTLFGRNTTGGAILITTSEPSTRPSAIFDVSYGRFNAQKYQAYATTGLTDDLAVSVEGLFSKGDGFTHNIYDGSLATGGGFGPESRVHRPGEYQNWAFRTALKWTPSDNTSLILRYGHADTDDPTGNVESTWVQNGLVLSAGDAIPGTVIAPDRGETSNNARMAFHLRTDTVQLTGRTDLGFAELSSYTQYRKERVVDVTDQDFTSASVLALDLPEKDRILSQEFLLNSKNEGPLQYTGGVFLFEHKIDAGVGLASGDNDFFAFSATGAKTRTYAAFLDGTYAVTPRLFLTAGLRFSHDEVRDPYYQTTPGVPGVFTFQPDYKSNKLSPRFVVRYKPTEQSSVYASFTKGYKSAIPDFRSTSGAPYLKPENIKAYEVGYKFANPTLSAEIAGFYYDYKNLQNGFYRAGETILSNAANSKIKGVDGSVKYRLGHGFELNAATTYMEATYKDYENAGFFNPIIVGGLFLGFDTSATANVSGNQMQKAPKWTTTFGGSYTTDLAGGTLVASTNYYHTSTVYFDPAHQFAQSPYDLLSARVEWTDPSSRYTVAVFGDNITDSKYITQANVGLAAAGKVWGAPATWGVSFRAKM